MMKKILFAFSAFTIVVTACNKNQLITEKINTPTKKTRQIIKPTTTQTWVYILGQCSSPAHNCASDVIVKPTHASAFAGLNTAINTSQTAVTSFFNSTTGMSLVDYFGSDYLDLFQSGDYTVKYVTNSTDGTTNYLVDETSTFDDEDPEYVLSTID